MDAMEYYFFSCIPPRLERRLSSARGIGSQAVTLNASRSFTLAEHWTVTEVNKSSLKNAIAAQDKFSSGKELNFLS